MVPTPPIYARDEQGNLITDNQGNLVIAENGGMDPNRPLLNGMVTSFFDAPGGFREEMQEFMISFGAEYAYDEKFMVRTGYFHENINKGGRKYFTMGVGFNYQRLGFDFSYLVPQVQNHPLAETLRFSLAYNIPR
jgi:hypothetical protein